MQRACLEQCLAHRECSVNTCSYFPRHRDGQQESGTFTRLLSSNTTAGAIPAQPQLPFLSPFNEVLLALSLPTFFVSGLKQSFFLKNLIFFNEGQLLYRILNNHLLFLKILWLGGWLFFQSS